MILLCSINLGKINKIKKNRKRVLTLVEKSCKMLIVFARGTEMHEWLSGGVSPCQGEGRGFESRLVLGFIPSCFRKKTLDNYILFC